MTSILMPLLALFQATTPGAPVYPPADPESLARLQAAAPILAGLPGVVLSSYPVEGRTPAAIRSSINRGRPAERDGGERFDGVTWWSYATRWQQSGPEQCLPDTAVATMTATVVLPDLLSRDRLSTREKAAWDGYFERLTRHELNHVRIAALGTQRMQAAMRAASSCDEMRAEQRRLSAETADAQREYDRTSEHGKREGAVYPSAGGR